MGIKPSSYIPRDRGVSLWAAIHTACSWPEPYAPAGRDLASRFQDLVLLDRHNHSTYVLLSQARDQSPPIAKDQCSRCREWSDSPILLASIVQTSGVHTAMPGMCSKSRSFVANAWMRSRRITATIRESLTSRPCCSRYCRLV
jgi:hypothetical protein